MWDRVCLVINGEGVTGMRTDSRQGVSEGPERIGGTTRPKQRRDIGSAGWAGRAEVKPPVAVGPNLREGMTWEETIESIVWLSSQRVENTSRTGSPGLKTGVAAGRYMAVSVRSRCDAA
jgi:hypothetical protein